MSSFPLVRYVVVGIVAIAALAALGSWLVRTRRISPFSALGRGLRRVTDPIITPVERRVVRMGGNPVHAGGWLVVLTAIAGVVLLSLLGWLLQSFHQVNIAAHAGTRATVALMINVVYRILIYALIVRVVAAWFGLYRYSRWIRPAYILTDWIVEPIRRVVPPLGAFDVSPIVAWFALMLLRAILFSLLRF